MRSQKELSMLVSELSKAKPDHQVIKLMCQKTGFQYSTDLIQLMSDILLTIERPEVNSKVSSEHKKNKNQPQERV
jgi:hypothetical protein